MRKIPFVAGLDGQERQEWLDVLGREASSYGFSVVSFADLTEEERRAADVAFVANPDPAEVVQLPNLKWVQSLWAGVERLVATPELAGIDIARLVDPGLARIMSEAVLAWTLYVHRDMPTYAAQQRVKQWKPIKLVNAADRRIGVLGLGELGRASAELLSRHGFQVSGWSRSGGEVPGVTVYSGPDGLNQILATSDILVVLLPLTSATTGLLNERSLRLLPQNASVINFARGPIIEDRALLQALDSGHLAHAVLDVFATEPLPEQDPYWAHDKVTVLPHISGPSPFDSAGGVVVGNVARYLTDGSLPETVDRAGGY